MASMSSWQLPAVQLRQLSRGRVGQRQPSRAPPAQVSLFKFFDRTAATTELAHSIDPAFVDWLASVGVQTSPLVAREAEGEGRGLYAAQAIAAAQQVVEVPGNLLITADAALAGSKASDLMREAELPEWSLVALYLVELRWRAAGNPAETWAPYVGVLPEDPASVLSWPRGEVERLLAGSAFLTKARAILTAADKSWRELQPLLQAAEQGSIFPPGVFTEAALRWAFGILLSRGVRLVSKGDSLALVPWADLLNHSPYVEAYIDWDHASSSAVLRSDKPYRTLEQVCISYGAKSGGELLLSYGFLLPAAANPHDSYPLIVELTPSAPAYEAKLAALQKLGLPAAAEYPLRLEGYPAGLLQHLAFVATPLQDVSDAPALAGLLLVDGVFPEVDGVDTRRVGAQQLRARCASLLQGYATSVEQDKELASTIGLAPAVVTGATDPASRQQRAAVCAALRLSERRILNRTLSVVSAGAGTRSA